MITYDGKNFIVNTIGCEQKKFSKINFNNSFEFSYKYFYLDGERIVNHLESYKVSLTSDDKNDFFHNDKSHMFTFFGISDSKGNPENYREYFSSVITKDNLPLRTRPSAVAKEICNLKENTRIKVLNINPRKTKIDNKYGFWVLVETPFREIGWVWSDNIKDFNYDFK